MFKMNALVSSARAFQLPPNIEGLKKEEVCHLCNQLDPKQTGGVAGINKKQVKKDKRQINEKVNENRKIKDIAETNINPKKIYMKEIGTEDWTSSTSRYQLERGKARNSTSRQTRRSGTS